MKKSIEEIKDIIVELKNKHGRVLNAKEFFKESGLGKYDIGRYKTTYSKLIDELGFTDEKELKRRYFRNNIDNIYDEYMNGASYQELADKYEVTDTFVWSEIKGTGKGFRNNHWTKEQLDYLENNYAIEEWKVIMEKLKPFTKQDIYSKASSKGLSREGFKWTEEQENFLKENYTVLPMDELVKIFGKTPAAIQTKANKLDVRIKEYWSNEEKELLVKLYPYHSNEDLVKFFPKRNLISIMGTAHHMGIYKDKEIYNEYFVNKTKKELIDKLLDFYNELGRTPTQLEINNNPNMGGHISYVRYFGSYTQACIEAGIPANEAMFGASYRLESLNGDICLSMKEKYITDLLYLNGVKYKKERFYRDILNDQDLGVIRCDWYIPSRHIIVEYFGMDDREDYRIRMNKKIKICKDHKVTLIDIYPNDLSYNYRGMVNKFANHGIIINPNIETPQETNKITV